MTVRRSTLKLPAALRDNWHIAALQENLTPNEMLIRELKSALKKAGLDPDRSPRTIEVAY